jgi:hypothetical protein
MMRVLGRLGATLAATFLMAGSALGFSGEDLVSGNPWHHDDITYRALYGDSRYEGAGFSRDAALGVAWHSDYVDSYLYNPLYWLEGGNRNRLRAGLVGRPELLKLHFDDVFSTGGITDTWQRYASGTLIGLYFASLEGVTGDVDMAHHVLGVSLHAVQDFYSHSNWVDDPARRCTTWSENAPDMRKLIQLATGAYDLSGSTGPSLHGEYSASCSLIRNADTDPLLDVICNGYSPFQNSGLCETFRACATSSTIPVSVDGSVLSNVVRLSEPGIALDSTWMAEVQAPNRGVVDKDGNFVFGQDGMHFPADQCEFILAGHGREGICNTGSVQLFAGAKDVAVRASTQWIKWLDEAMKAMGPEEAAFWERVKGGGGNVPNRIRDFEDIGRLPYQFLTAGPYPVGDPSTGDRPMRPDDAGWYLRLEVETANERFAGTNADIYAELSGEGWTQPYLLDHLPGIINPVMGYDDFEPDDNAAYMLGPLPGQPSILRFVNKLPDISDAFWTEYAQSVEAFIEEVRQGLLTIVAGNADLVGTGKHFLTTPDVKAKLAGKLSSDETLNVNGGEQGEFDIIYRLRPVQTPLSPEEAARGWLAFEVELRRLDSLEESTVDRFSTADEPFVIFLVSPLNGQADPVRAYLSDPVPDMDKGESHVFARRTGSSSIVKVPPEGGVVISAQIFESDSETAADRDRLRRIHESGLKAVEGESDERLLVALNAALAADWQPSHVNAFAFRRGDAPMAGTVLDTDDLPLLEGNTNSSALGLDFSAIRRLGSPATDFIAWTAEPPDPKLTLAGKWYAHNLPCENPVPVQPVELFIEDGKVSGIKYEPGDDCVVGNEEVITGTIEERTIDATLAIRDPKDKEVIEDVPPNFQDPAFDPNIALEGRWLIEWGGESGEPPGFATLTRGIARNCNVVPCEFYRDPDSAWSVRSHSPGQAGATGEVTFAGVGSFQVEWSYEHLGNWGGTSSISQVADHFLAGQWTYNDRTGPETWTRIDPLIERVDAFSQVEDSVKLGERPVRVVSNFNADPDAMRGNVPSFHLEVRGKNLFGPVYYWVPPSSGLELGSRFYYMCTLKDGTEWYNTTYGRCIGDGVEVDGLQLEVNVWNAKPGTYTMLVNGVEIAIALELPRWVDPAEAKLAVDSCSVISEVDARHNPPLKFTRYDPNPKPPVPVQ